MLPTLAILLALAANPDWDAAKADRARLSTSDIPYTYYLHTHSAPSDADRLVLDSMVPFSVCSLSHKTDLSRQIPVQVTDTLYRIDTRGLGWEKVLAKELVKHYPYAPEIVRNGHAPLVVDALWFVANTLDDEEAPGLQYELLYSGKAPKTEAEYLKFWGIQDDPRYVFGVIEEKSGVARAKKRLVESRPGAQRNAGWVTRDSARIRGKSDPLENLPNKAKHDASELIVSMRKWLAGDSGTLHTFFLSNAKGERQVKAPALIAIDKTDVRGVEVRNSSSCIYCHVEGIRPPSDPDGFKRYILSGARIAADRKSTDEIDTYHTSDIAKEVDRSNEDYTDGLKIVNGLSPAENARAFAHCVKLYDADLATEQIARELYTTPEDLQLALADYTTRNQVSARFSEAAQGEAISRDAFIENFEHMERAVAQWQGR